MGSASLISLVASDLRREGLRQTGRRGLPAETVLRCAMLKQQRQLSYEELAFHLEDSASFRAFARLPLAWSPKKSVLHRTISAIRPETWEAVNRALIAAAQQEKLEAGAVVRIDSTVTAALMHEPSDSALLWDAVRLMTRLLRQAAALPGAPSMRWHDRRRMAKRCASAIHTAAARQPAPALPQADRRHSCHPGGAAASRQAADRPCRHRGRALARPGGALSAADRARAGPERAPGAARPGGAGQRQAGQPVRAACRHHRQSLPSRGGAPATCNTATSSTWSPARAA